MAAPVSRITRALGKAKKMMAEANSPTLELNRVVENYKTALKEADIETSAVTNKIKEKPKSTFAEERKAARAKDATEKAAKEAKVVNPDKANVSAQSNTTQQVAQNQVQKNQAEVAKANEEAISQIDETAGFNKYRPFNSTIGALKDMRPYYRMHY